MSGMNAPGNKDGPSGRIKVTSGGVLAIFVVCAVAAAAVAAPFIEITFRKLAGVEGQDTLQLTVAGLNGALQRYEPLPSLIAERPALAALLRAPNDTELLAQVNEDLRLAAHRLKASDVYLMDVAGLTLAASSYKKELSFVGRSFAYRPYFTQALEGGTGRYFALGTTSGQRGYFYAAPVEDGERIVGVVTVKFTVDEFEQAWRNGDHQIIVSDLKGVVFMSSRPEWHFRTLQPLSASDLAEIEVNRQYPVNQLRPLINQMDSVGDDMTLMTVEDSGIKTIYVSSSAYIPDAGWHVSILVPTAKARTQTLAALLIMVLAIMLIGLIAAFYLQRRARLMERIEAQETAQAQLEIRVEERTRDLNRSNSQLKEEISERRAAETQLRQTQTELVQAGKLAALGQMSAALSHEFNQPLAAVKSYADNAVKLLDIGRTGETRENISRISDMADRMAAISKNLRNFARRPMEQVRPVPLVTIVNDAAGLLQPRLAAANATLQFTSPEHDCWVMGGHIRLQQVVVNLFTNALDAMKGQNEPRIDVQILDRDGRFLLTVRDTGPGLPEDVADRVFDPFFTTKQPGEGMGLGLSISYNIIKDFDGNLSAQNHSDGGAVFIVELRAASDPGDLGDPGRARKDAAE